MVIARVLAKNANIIIMDEPTARLGHGEVTKLLKYIQYLKTCGKTIIYISHRLEEIFEICDTICATARRFRPLPPPRWTATS